MAMSHKKNDVVWLFAKERPGLSAVRSFLIENFTHVNFFVGTTEDPFPTITSEMGRADLSISYISPWIIPERILRTTGKFAINFHPGPPEYPGIGCTNFAIYNGEGQFGVTAHHMNPKVDTGKIITVSRFPISNEDSVYSVTEKSYHHLLELFYNVMNYYLKNNKLSQSDEQWKKKPYTRKELNDLCRITASMSAEEIQKRIKATTFPCMPGAYIEISGKQFPYKFQK